MEKSFFIVLILMFSVNSGFSQTGPEGRFYLGQTPPPGVIPERFKLSINTGSFAAERIAISNDGKEFYYSEVRSYYPAKGDTIKRYIYAGDRWTGPVTLFPGYLAPALSNSGDTLYFETAGSSYESYRSVRCGTGWGPPERVLKNLNSAHYLQTTSKGTYFLSSIPGNSIGRGDWSRLKISSSDTVASSLGRPLNTEWDNLDFFISRDESFIIVAAINGLAVSYSKADGGWTTPRNLGKEINFGLASWGPYVTPDKKYLFYTTGTKPDYSDAGIFWCRIDRLIDSLKTSNSVPYLQNKIEGQKGYVRRPFYFRIPDDAFIDEDGDKGFTYSATLNTGQPLPSWLTLNKSTGEFSGTPSETGELTIICYASDKENASGIGVFRLIITQ